MSVKQISVFLENKPGSLADMTRTLTENGIGMRAFSLAETSDFGIARVIVDDLSKSTAALRDAGFVHTVSSVLAVAIPDGPGGLNQALAVLREGEVNVQYMYAFLGGKMDGAWMIFKVTGHHRAAALLTQRGFRLVDQEELSGL